MRQPGRWMGRRGATRRTANSWGPWLPAALSATIALGSAAVGWGREPGDAARAGRDEQGLIAIERAWLNAENAATLERILAPDYVHVIPGAGFITRDQQIAWFKSHPIPPGVKRRFEDLRERIYGDVGIVNGVVVRTTSDGAAPRRTLFTDVFVYREGRWQAVNSQENEAAR